MPKSPKRQKIKYKDKYKAYVYPIHNGVEYWRFWEDKSEIVYVLDPEDDHVLATYHKVARLNDPKQAALAERYFSESDMEVYVPLPENRVEERLAVAYTADLMYNLFMTYTKEGGNAMTAEQMAYRIEEEIELCSIAHKNLPIITEQLDTFRKEPLCRHIYQFFIVNSFIRKRDSMSVKYVSELFDVSYQEALDAFRVIESKGYAESIQVPESESHKGAFFKLKIDLSKYREYIPSETKGDTQSSFTSHGIVISVKKGSKSIQKI